MKHLIDLNEIESDEAMWEQSKFYRDHYKLCAITVVLLVAVIIIF